MLKALLLRQIMMNDSTGGGTRTNFTETAEERETVNQNFETYLDDAVKFVNGREAKFLKENLKA
jgi:hypothetical protein